MIEVALVVNANQIQITIFVYVGLHDVEVSVRVQLLGLLLPHQVNRLLFIVVAEASSARQTIMLPLLQVRLLIDAQAGERIVKYTRRAVGADWTLCRVAERQGQLLLVARLTVRN